MRFHRFRFFLFVTWRRLRRLGGDFTEAESSSRAHELTALWESRWPGAEPIGHELRPRFADRWVRFHLQSAPELPWSPSVIEGEIHRYRTVLSDLLTLSGSNQVVVIGRDWGPEDHAGGWTKQSLPGRWPWRRYFDQDAESESYFWVSPIETIEDLEPLYPLIENDEARVVVTDAAMTWIYAPYDRGIDVFLPDEATRDWLTEKRRDWLSADADGL